MISKSRSFPINAPWTGFFKGFWAPLRAFKLLLQSPQTLTWALIPLAINIALYVLFFIYGSRWLNGWVELWSTQVARTIPSWLPAATVSLSHVLLKFLSWLVLALVAAISFTFVSTIICSPFNDALSKAALKVRRKQLQITTAPAALSHSVFRTLKLEVFRTLILAVGGILALILGIIPLLQIPAIIIGAMLLSFEYFGYPFSQKTERLIPVAYFTLRHPFVAMGFGSFLLLIMALPFTSVFYIPLAVTGATLLFAEIEG